MRNFLKLRCLTDWGSLYLATCSAEAMLPLVFYFHTLATSLKQEFKNYLLSMKSPAVVNAKISTQSMFVPFSKGIKKIRFMNKLEILENLLHIIELYLLILNGNKDDYTYYTYLLWLHFLLTSKIPIIHLSEISPSVATNFHI